MFVAGATLQVYTGSGSSFPYPEYGLALEDAEFCVIEPTGGDFWLFEDDSIMALEDCTGGWILESSGSSVAADVRRYVIGLGPQAKQRNHPWPSFSS